MRSLMYQRILVFCLLLFPALLFAQGRVINLAERDAVMNPKLLPGPEVFHFEVKEMNIDTLSQISEPVVVSFNFVSVSNKPVAVSRVETCCGCEVSFFEKGIINPGAHSNIEIIFNPSGHVGKFVRDIWVYSSLSNDYPVVKLRLKAFVNLSEIPK